MEDLIMKVLYDVLMLLAAVAAAFLIGFLRSKLGAEKLKKINEEFIAKQDLAHIAVRFVEQAYRDLNGAEKYNMAAEWITEQANQQGLEIGEDEVKGLIEATLRQIKDELGEEWAEQISSDTG